MEPLAALDAGVLSMALEEEAAFDRFWLPPEPWWDALLRKKAPFAAAVERQLVRGLTWPRAEVVDVRKPDHGVRPIALMAPDVRMVYRAFASALVPSVERPDRTADRYAEFVMKPIRNAYVHQVGLRRMGDTRYSHVLIADLASFYQYIDHAILRDELDIAGKDIGLVDGVIQFLHEVEGRGFGLPQRSEPSDWLSEYYAARVERSLVRDGFDVWRYADDFRVGCKTYAEALNAIEALSRSAREVGLVLNEKKSSTPMFLTYLGNNADVAVVDASAEINPVDVEAAVTSDYLPEDDVQAVDEAQSVLGSLWDPQADRQSRDDSWDVRELEAERHRAVRRALNTLTKFSNPAGVTALLSLMAYQPAMTHQVIRYAEAVAPVATSEVGDVLDRAISRISMTDWQRAWLAYGLRACDQTIAAGSQRAAWLENQLSRTSSLAASEAAVTLAENGMVGFDQLEAAVREVSSDFTPWYLHSIAILHHRGDAGTAQVGALRQVSPVAAAILS